MNFSIWFQCWNLWCSKVCHLFWLQLRSTVMTILHICHMAKTKFGCGACDKYEVWLNSQQYNFWGVRYFSIWWISYQVAREQARRVETRSEFLITFRRIAGLPRLSKIPDGTLLFKYAWEINQINSAANLMDSSEKNIWTLKIWVELSWS